MTAAKRAAQAQVIDLWHRKARAGEQVYYPADHANGPVWCMDKTHFRKPGTKVCTTRHGRGKRWRAYCVDHEGQARSKHFDNKADAQRHVDATTTALGTGTYTDPQRSAVTFGVMAEAWLRTKEASNLAPKTVEGYRGILEVVVLPKWEKYRLRDMHHEDVQGWIAWLSTDPAARRHRKKSAPDVGLSPARVIQIHQVMHQVFAYAIRTKYIAQNPADNVPLPRKPRSKDLALTHDQVRTLAEETANAKVRQRAGTVPARTSPTQLATMVRMLAYAGLRFGECAALRVSDVDIEARRLRVFKGITHVRGLGRVEGDTKVHQRRHTPILTAWLADELKTVIKGRSPDEYLFPAPDGGAMSEGWFRVRFDKAVAQLGIPGVVPNTLRHTAGSLAISESSSGAGVLMASKLLGHRNVTTTANVYSHMLDGDWDKLGAAMDKATQAAQTRSADTAP